MLWILFTIIGSGAQNGFVKWGLLNECDLKIPLAISVIETMGYIMSIGIGFYSMVKVRRHYGKADPYPLMEQEMVEIPMSARSSRPTEFSDIGPDRI